MTFKNTNFFYILSYISFALNLLSILLSTNAITMAFALNLLSILLSINAITTALAFRSRTFNWLGDNGKHVGAKKIYLHKQNKYPSEQWNLCSYFKKNAM